jgi:hypothetical protein
MNGTAASVAIGCTAADVGVPTEPTSAKTLSSLISFFAASIDLPGS